MTMHLRFVITFADRRLLIGVMALVAAIVLPLDARGETPLTRVTFRIQDETRTVEGKVLVEAVDGGILLLARDGRLWPIAAKQLSQREATDRSFRPLTSEETADRLLSRFGKGFGVVQTKHYVICTNTNREYAEWCGSLFERLLSSFLAFWGRRGLDLHEPAAPLVAVVFADERQFDEFASADAGPAARDSHGYYSIDNNYVVLYNLTSHTTGGRLARSAAEIRRRLAAAGLNVATVVHEATHQIAFNCGMHRRYADNPLWLVEGMAMFFETPDLNSRNGWRTAGELNAGRLRRFREYVVNRREPESLRTLVAGSERFADAALAEDAYAEAWALNYFLIKTRRMEYIEFLKRVADKPALRWDQPEQRLDEFQTAFGDDLAEFDRSFLRYMSRHVRK